jgi:hypothetical protein
MRRIDGAALTAGDDHIANGRAPGAFSARRTASAGTLDREHPQG